MSNQSDKKEKFQAISKDLLISYISVIKMLNVLKLRSVFKLFAFSLTNSCIIEQLNFWLIKTYFRICIITCSCTKVGML